MTTVSSPSSRRGRRLAISTVIAAGGLALALAGCATHGVNPYEKTGALPSDYHTNHPITIQDEVATLDVPVSVDTARLPKPQLANIQFFAQAFLGSGSDLIAVVAPSGSPNQVAAAGAAVQAEDVLRQAGVSPKAISYRVYRAGPGEKTAPVRIAYDRIAAHTDPCGPWTDQVSSNSQNDDYGAFGCATQQNLAALVQNPLDLLYPRGMTPADAARRADVLDKYRKGESFVSDTSAETGGTVATGVGSP